MNLVIALSLSILTFLCGYACWYIVRGRKPARAKARDEEPAEKEKPAVVGKDSYCYPKINDIMGYDFISVVNVPESLMRPVPETPEPPKEESWDTTAGVGLKTVSESEMKDLESDSYPFEQVQRRPPLRAGLPKFINEQPEKPEDSVEETSVINFNADEFDTLQQIASKPVEWKNRIPDDSQDLSRDDRLDLAINANPDMIEEHDDETADMTTAREHEAMMKLLALENGYGASEDMSDVGSQIMDEIGSGGEEDSEDTEE